MLKEYNKTIRVLRGIEPTYIWGMSPTYYHNNIQYLTLKLLKFVVQNLNLCALLFIVHRWFNGQR